MEADISVKAYVQAASSTKNVQTSPKVNSTPSYKATSSALMFNAVLAEAFRSDGTVQNAHVTWNAIPSAVIYSLEYDDLLSTGMSETYNYNLTGTLQYVPVPKYN